MLELSCYGAAFADVLSTSVLYKLHTHHACSDAVAVAAV